MDSYKYTTFANFCQNKDTIATTCNCLVCGNLCKRHSIASRKVRDISLEGDATFVVQVGVYFCRTCNKYFRINPSFVTKGKHYSNRVLEKNYSGIVEDKTTFTAIPKRLKRDFNVSPSKSTCYRWFHSQAKKIDLADSYTPWVAKNFSGVMAIDEVYDGYAVFFATDPVAKTTLGYHLCESATREELESFLLRLKGFGVEPKVLIRDGAPIYRHIPKKIWPKLRLQLCTFHVIRLYQKLVIDTLREYRKTLLKSSRKKDCSDPNELKNDVKLMWKYRYAFATRFEKLKPEKQEVLNYLAKKYMHLKVLLCFEKDLLNLFSRNQTKEEMEKRRNHFLINEWYQWDKHLSKAVNFVRSIYFLEAVEFMNHENLDSTSNSVERANRWFRKRQKTHYRNRKAETITNMLNADLMRQMELKKPSLLVQAEVA